LASPSPDRNGSVFAAFSLPEPRRNTMPATSKAQQKAAGAALSANRGETKRSELKGASKEMYDSMNEKQLEEFAETKRKGLPERKTAKH